MTNAIQIETTFDHSARLLTSAVGATVDEFNKAHDIFSKAAQANKDFDYVVSALASSDISDLAVITACVKAGECANPLKPYKVSADLAEVVQEIVRDGPSSSSATIEAVVNHANGKLNRLEAGQLAFAVAHESGNDMAMLAAMLGDGAGQLPF